MKQRAREAQRAAAGDTLEAVAGEFFRRDGTKLRSAKDWQRDLERLVYPTLGRRPIADIRRREIVRLLDRIEDTTGAAQADTVLAIVRRVMNWHAARDDDFRSPIVKGMRRWKPSEHTRARVLTDDEIRAVWRTAEGMAGPFGHYCKFLLLTAARRNEAAHLRWQEIVGTDWLLPASRNKTKNDLTRPLSAAALKALADVPRIAGSDFVLPPTAVASAAWRGASGKSTKRLVSSVGRCMTCGALLDRSCRELACHPNTPNVVWATRSAASKVSTIDIRTAKKCAWPMSAWPH